MIVSARRKRDRHLSLIQKVNERLSRQNVVVAELKEDLKLGDLKATTLSKS